MASKGSALPRRASLVRAFALYACAALGYFVATDIALERILPNRLSFQILQTVCDFAFVLFTIYLLGRLYRQVAVQRERLKSIWHLAIESGLDYESQALAVLAEGTEALGLEHGTIGHIDGEHFVVDITDDERQTDYKLKLSDAIESRAALRNRIISSPDIALNSRLRDYGSAKAAIMRAFVSVPFRVKERRFSLSFHSERPRATQFTVDDLEYLELLGNFFGRTILQNEQETEISRLAFSDALTGLVNRTQFRQMLRRQIAFAERHHSRFCILFVDLDHFKTVNDTLGHSAGDSVLAEAARRIQQVVREEDVVARVGGDEFCVIATLVGDEAAGEILARRICSSLRDPFPVGVRRFNLSASIGVAFYPRDGDAVEKLIEHADAAAYFSKSAGRDRYTFYRAQIYEQLKILPISTR